MSAPISELPLENISQLMILLKQLLEFMMSLFKEVIEIPAARGIVTPLFYYFSNFDDFFFYQFHDRTYSETINQLFSHISDIESMKWSLINI